MTAAAVPSASLSVFAGGGPPGLVVACSEAGFDGALADVGVGRHWLRTPAATVPLTGDDAVAALLRVAVGPLGVEEVAVCGHLNCAHVPEDGASATWAPSRQRGRLPVNLVRSQRHVLEQLVVLRSHPVTGPLVRAGRLRLRVLFHAFEAGPLLAFDEAAKRFTVADDWPA